MSSIKSNYPLSSPQNIANVVVPAAVGLTIAAVKPKKVISAQNALTDALQDVILKNGRAVLPDGSFFSGLLETVNKKGDKIAIKYENGFMKESFVNGSLHKIYEDLKNIPAYIGTNIAKYTRNQGVKIKTLENGELSKISMHLYDDSGKVKRTIEQNSDRVYNMLDIKDAKIIAKSKLKSLNLVSQISDNNGRLVKTVTTEGPLTFIMEHNPDGTKTEIGSRMLYDIVGTPATSYKASKPKIARFYDKESTKPDRVIKTSFQNGKHVFEDISSMPDGNKRTLRIELPVGKLNDEKNNYIVFTLKNGDDTCYHAIIGEQGKNVGYNVSTKKMNELKKLMQKSIEKAQECGIEFDYQKVMENLPKILVF